jgi:hypothetical protein
MEHIEEFGIWNAEVGKRQSPWSQVTSLLKKQSSKHYVLYLMPSVLCFIIPHSPLRILSSLYKPVFWCYFAQLGMEEKKT